MKHFQLTRNASGQLVFMSADGHTIEGVTAVRAFPIAAPDMSIAVVSTDGRELAWIDSLSMLDAEMRRLIEDELAIREFLPEIRRIRHISRFATPSTWQVETDRGATSLMLKGEEDIRRIDGSALLIADCHGIQFLVRNVAALDSASRKLLDRFL